MMDNGGQEVKGLPWAEPVSGSSTGSYALAALSSLVAMGVDCGEGGLMPF